LAGKKNLNTFVSTNEYFTICPHCKGESYYYNVHKETGWCFKCEKSTGKNYVPEALGGHNAALSAAIRTVHEKETEVFYEGLKQAVAITGVDRKTQDAVEYLLSRRISIDTAHKAGLLYNSSNRCLYFPVNSPVPKHPTQYIHRNIDDKIYKSQKGLNKKMGFVFGLRHVKQTEKIIIVEGPFDVLSPGLLGHAIALCGTQLFLTTNFWLSDFKEVNIWLDPDAEAKAEHIRESLMFDYSMKNVNIIRHPHEPGDCECASFLSMLKR
jgi:hypothetical protein